MEYGDNLWTVDNGFLQLLFSKGMPDKSISIDVKIEEKSNHERRYTEPQDGIITVTLERGQPGPGQP